MFVSSEPVALAFRDPFISRWVFDVEILARLVHRGNVNPHIAICEYPLMEWHDVKGSKIRLKDFLGRVLGFRPYSFCLQSILIELSAGICWNDLQAR